MRVVKPLLVAAVGGLFVAASLPPFDLWFLAPVGYALFASTLLDGSRRTRTLRAGGFFLAYFVVGLAWSVEFSVVAFIALLLVEALLATAPFVLTPQAPRVALVAFPALVTIGEVLRYRVPLGGMPMAGPVLGQVDGPLLPVARLGGDFAMVLLTALAGVGLFALWRHRALGIAALTTVIVVVTLGWLSDAPPAVGPLRIAYVQGGGPRGLRAVENTFTDVYGNQVDANAGVRTPVDLVVWPEDVIDLSGPVEDDPIRFDVGGLAKKLNTTLVAGVVEDSGETKFRNAAVAWDRSGNIVDRYDKVHRVPFGEYVPARGLVSRLADISAVPAIRWPATATEFCSHGRGSSASLSPTKCSSPIGPASPSTPAARSCWCRRTRRRFGVARCPRRKSPPPSCGQSKWAATSSKRPRQAIAPSSTPMETPQRSRNWA